MRETFINEIINQYRDQFDAKLLEKEEDKKNVRAACIFMYAFGINGICDGMYIFHILDEASNASEALDKLMSSYSSSMCRITDWERRVLVPLLENGDARLSAVRALTYNALTKTRYDIRSGKADSIRLDYLRRRESLLVEHRDRMTVEGKEARVEEKARRHSVHIRVNKATTKSLERLFSNMDAEPEITSFHAEGKADDGAMITVDLEFDEHKKPRLAFRVVLSDGSFTAPEYLHDLRHIFVDIEYKGQYYDAMLYLYNVIEHDAEWYQKQRERRNFVYPQNLVAEIFGRNDAENLTEDQKKGLEDYLAHLDDRSRKMVYLRYQAKESYNAIGEKFALTGGRVQTLIHAALRKLRLMESADHYLEKGMDAVQKERAARIANQEPVYNEIQIQDIAVLSQRCRNSLVRGRIQTVSDLKNHTWEDILALRNFGASCQKELQEYLNTQGLYLKDEP